MERAIQSEELSTGTGARDLTTRQPWDRFYLFYYYCDTLIVPHRMGMKL